MAWLVVTGNGTWSIVLGKKWVEPEEGNELAQGKWVYEAPMYRAGKHHVGDHVRVKAEEEGYPGNVFFFEDDDEPDLMEPDDTGTLRPEDIRSGTRKVGVHLALVEGEPEPEPVVDPQGLPLDYPCPSCERAFPSDGSRVRHIEFDHTRRHEVLQRRELRAVEQAAEEKAIADRLREHEGKLPPWEREGITP